MPITARPQQRAVNVRICPGSHPESLSDGFYRRRCRVINYSVFMINPGPQLFIGGVITSPNTSGRPTDDDLPCCCFVCCGLSPTRQWEHHNNKSTEGLPAQDSRPSPVSACRRLELFATQAQHIIIVVVREALQLDVIGLGVQQLVQ